MCGRCSFIEEGNKDYISNLINFRKRELVSDVILEIQMYQPLAHRFQPNPLMMHLLNQLPHHVDNEKLYQLSLLREPRLAIAPIVASALLTAFRPLHHRSFLP